MSGAWQEQPAKLLHHYDRSAQHAAHEIIRRYSSSFFLASNLLRGHVKTDIRSMYAVVRIADEIADGAGYGAGLNAHHTCVLIPQNTGTSVTLVWEPSSSIPGDRKALRVSALIFVLKHGL